MREIKFRAWDTKWKKMVYDGTCDKIEGSEGDVASYLRIGFDGSVRAYTDDDGGKSGFWEHGANVPNDRFIPMLATGLKDKAGRDVFEDDVVRFPDGRMRKIAWNADAAAVSQDAHYNKNQHRWPFTCDDACVCEVVGNVWEHPDLCGAHDGGKE